MKNVQEKQKTEIGNFHNFLIEIMMKQGLTQQDIFIIHLDKKFWTGLVGLIHCNPWKFTSNPLYVDFYQF